VPDELKRTERGFRIYAELQVRGRELRVQESSLATDRRVWLFSEEGIAVDLNEAQARTVRDALSAFLEDR
jgi:hypothetical protein